jgi:hypothetical protein
MIARRRCIMYLLRKCVLMFVLLFLLISSGCRGGGIIYHIDDNVDFSFIKRVAIMPLDNLTGEKTAGELIRQVVISELLASGLVEVVVPGEVLYAINRLNIKNISSPNEKEIKALGKALKVEAIIVGSIGQYGQIKTGSVSAPEVTITLMMADTGTGNIIWSITNTHGGASFLTRHFGADSETMSEAVLAVVRESIQTLFEY